MKIKKFSHAAAIAAVAATILSLTAGGGKSTSSEGIAGSSVTDSVLTKVKAEDNLSMSGTYAVFTSYGNKLQTFIPSISGWYHITLAGAPSHGNTNNGCQTDFDMNLTAGNTYYIHVGKKITGSIDDRDEYAETYLTTSSSTNDVIASAAGSYNSGFNSPAGSSYVNESDTVKQSGTVGGFSLYPNACAIIRYLGTSSGSVSSSSTGTSYTIHFEPGASDAVNTALDQTITGTDHINGNVYTRSGYEFKDWTLTDKNNKTYKLADGASFTPTDDMVIDGKITLTAEWTTDSGVTVTIPQSISIDKKSVGAVNAKETYPIKVLNPGRKKVSITSTVSDLSIGSGKSKETISARLYSSTDTNGNPVQINVTGPNTILNDTLVLSGTAHYAGKYSGHAQYSVNIA